MLLKEIIVFLDADILDYDKIYKYVRGTYKRKKCRF